MPWRMQIKTPSTNNEWKDIRPSGKNAEPYEYSTKEEAERMLDICYREVARGFYEDSFVRVKEVGKEKT